MKSAGDTSSLVERSLQQLVKFLFLAFILALALTRKLSLPHASSYCAPCIGWASSTSDA